MPTKQPQDRKPAKGAPYRFTAAGKSYTLPPVTAGKDALTGRDLRDASVNGEAGQLAYLFKVLEAAKPTPAALNALYDLKQSETLEILIAWGDHGDGDGASLGE